MTQTQQRRGKNIYKKEKKKGTQDVKVRSPVQSQVEYSRRGGRTIESIEILRLILGWLAGLIGGKEQAQRIYRSARGESAGRRQFGQSERPVSLDVLPL